MPSKQSDKKRAAKQKQWEEEARQLTNMRAVAPRLKAFARARGYQFRYFDFLDSYESIFNELAREARTKYPSLVCIVEIPREDYDHIDYTQYGIGADWQHIEFLDQSSEAETYNDRDETANLAGFTRAYLDTEGRTRTIVVTPKSVRCNSQHRDLKFNLKLLALLHELGHVQDMEGQINFNCVERTADIVTAEVYAHRFALSEANRLGLFTVAETLAKSLDQYRGGADYRAVVAERVLDGYQPYSGPQWGDVMAGEATTAELAMLRKMML